MSFTELVNKFWVWWVTGNGMVPYTQELAENRAFQLVMVVVCIVFMTSIVFSKKVRSYFF